VRIVSATSRNLDDEIARGSFRSDLFYRLSEVTLRIPPLRQRLDDIPTLAHAFLAQSCERLCKNFDHIEPELIVKLQTYQWPGNARELKSAIDRMVIPFDGPVLRAQWWDRPNVGAAAGPTSSSPSSPTPAESTARPPSTVAPAFIPNKKQKMELAKKLLDESDNNYTWVSAQLGVNVSTLYRWRKAGKVE